MEDFEIQEAEQLQETDNDQEDQEDQDFQEMDPAFLEVQIHLEVEKAFQFLGKKPFEFQAETCEEVLRAFLIEHRKNVILNAPTGSGKSILGAVIAIAMGELVRNLGLQLDSSTAAELASIFLMHQNILVKQYRNTFQGVNGFYQIYGADNYKCPILEARRAEDDSASHCIRKVLEKTSNKEKELHICKNSCEFYRSRMIKNKVPFLITNYDLYFSYKMIPHVNILQQRVLTIFDEGHTVNDVFLKHLELSFSDKSLRILMEDLRDIDNTSIAQEKVKELQKLFDDSGSVEPKESDAFKYIEILDSVYSTIIGCLNQKLGGYCDSDIQDAYSLKEYTKENKKLSKYTRLHQNVTNFREVNTEYVIEIKLDEKEINIKPIFVGANSGKILGKNYNLFMSATISDYLMQQMLSMGPETIKFINMPSSFPKAHKRVVFFDSIAMNYNSLKTQETQKRICDDIALIVNFHQENNDKGIILVPSFKMVDLVVQALDGLKGIAIFNQTPGNSLEGVLNGFKLYKGGSAVLVSPSMFEGVDLPDDASRFQIFVKAPYASLGDKRMQYILDKYPEVYKVQTIMKVIQGCGRSVRNKDDHAVTYFLDSNLQRLWHSSKNVWVSQFQTEEVGS